MRLIGVWPSEKALSYFAGYLQSLGIHSRILPHEDQFELWVIKDQDLERARQEWSEFITNPDAQQYRVRIKKKSSSESDRQLKAHYRRYFKRPRGNTLTMLVIVIAVLCFLVQRTVWPGLTQQLLIVRPGQAALQSWLYNPWRLFSPMFLHMSLLHLLFNLYWLYDMGSLIEVKESRWFYVLLLLTTALISHMAQLFLVGPAFGGLSGVVYGLFGYLWFLSRYRPWSGYYMRSDIAYWLIGWMVLGFVGVLGPVANWAHLGGLIAGVMLALMRGRS